MGHREQPRSAPVGLTAGDRFKTPWGPLEIEAVDRSRDEYDVHDPQTGERTTVRHQFFLEMMNANVSGSRHGSGWDDLEDDL